MTWVMAVTLLQIIFKKGQFTTPHWFLLFFYFSMVSIINIRVWYSHMTCILISVRSNNSNSLYNWEVGVGKVPHSGYEINCLGPKSSCAKGKRNWCTFCSFKSENMNPVHWVLFTELPGHLGNRALVTGKTMKWLLIRERKIIKEEDLLHVVPESENSPGGYMLEREV